VNTAPPGRLPTNDFADLTYVLPLKASSPADAELSQYVAWLGSLMDVIVVDGSPRPAFAVNATRWRDPVRHLPVRSRSLNGKVAGVCDGVSAARTRWIIVADDDVRYDESALSAVAHLLVRHDVVVPQNYFAPARWHTHWDTGRTLINRALGSDYAGTIAVRRDAFVSTRGYCGAVLFENLELIRTLLAHGFDVHHACDAFVARRPPSARHFAGQRIRQAYDSLAQPARLAAELALLPVLAIGGCRSRSFAPAAALAVMTVAEVGRRRAGGRRVFSWLATVSAPLWVAERAVCSWLALGSFLLGGVRYAGRRVRTAAHRRSSLTTSSCPERACSCALVLRDGPAPRHRQLVGA
jgi:glycosyl transferase family 2